MKHFLFVFGFLLAGNLFGQSSPQRVQMAEKMTTVPLSPELLWQLDRLSALGITKDEKQLVFKLSSPKMEENVINSRFFSIPLNGGPLTTLESAESVLKDKNVSPDGKYKLSHKEVKISKVKGVDYYPDLKKSNVLIYDELGHRHWDTWTDGSFNHVFLSFTAEGTDMTTDILQNEPYHCPQKPFGGAEDYVWHPDSKSIVYVCKKQTGTQSMLSTNTDLYQYYIESGQVKNLTINNKGYDTYPMFNYKGHLAYLSMKTDGYEADKQDLIVLMDEKMTNLTKNWDGTVANFVWAKSGDKIYFTAPIDGTVQLFQVNIPTGKKSTIAIEQITTGDWDITSIIAEIDGKLYVTRTDMNTAPEIYSYDLALKDWKQVTQVNTNKYNLISKSKIERRYVTTTDKKSMLVWVIYPPNFDPKKKYPTLLYCQGGPQSQVSQFYSFRWNFQLMAAQGYIVVAPNRRGLPGFGVEWNQQISKDYGGQNIKDYLSAIDEVSKEPFVDKKRRGAVGASYGGYSIFYLAGVHEGRFSSLISHCGIFNTQSMYGSTEEMFFINYDMGGPYWESKNAMSFTDFNPASKVAKWKTPILIFQGEKDFRVPVGQALEGFTAAQLKGIKSRLINFPDENHWIAKPQNGLLWQREFYRWLKETL
ncbi:MAG: S9 family peptidase [Saprospiraceae bacterium]